MTMVDSVQFTIPLQQYIVWGERIADKPIDDRYLKLGLRIQSQLTSRLDRS
ncbi:hypothetical protein [Nocardia cerradoensis]|uniref:hypothetical protein n=1 Tax=Nocardia cerradoensis TaxID=85688 RepID=UPI0016752200|nr:hypothetical protein [Nocardia cerradoensis]